jgi:hypothetical protein
MSPLFYPNPTFRVVSSLTLKEKETRLPVENEIKTKEQFESEKEHQRNGCAPSYPSPQQHARDAGRLEFRLVGKNPNNRAEGQFIIDWLHVMNEFVKMVCFSSIPPLPFFR